jgi:hypothetical protein
MWGIWGELDSAGGYTGLPSELLQRRAQHEGHLTLSEHVEECSAGFDDGQHKERADGSWVGGYEGGDVRDGAGCGTKATRRLMG